MKFFNIVTGLTLMLSFCRSSGEGLIVFSKGLSKLFKSSAAETFSNPYRDLSKIRKKFICARIRNYKIIAPVLPCRSAILLEKTHRFSSIIHDEFVTATNSILRILNLSVPALACKNRTSIIYMTYSSNFELHYVFGRFSSDYKYKKLIAVYKPYLKIIEPRKHFADLFAIPPEVAVQQNLANLDLDNPES